MSNREKYIDRLEKQLEELKALNHEHSATELTITRLKLISDEEYEIKYHEMEKIMFTKTNEAKLKYNESCPK